VLWHWVALARTSEQNQSPPDEDEVIPPKLRLLIARLRYEEIRRNLNPERELDRDLHAELTRTLRAIDQKIADCA
jgi:hypothetical protein